LEGEVPSDFIHVNTAERNFALPSVLVGLLSACLQIY